MNSALPHHGTRATVVCVIAGLLLLVLPRAHLEQLRSFVRSALLPGQKLAVQGADRVVQSFRSALSSELQRQAMEIDDLRQQLSQSELQQRQSQLIATVAHQKLAELEQRPQPLDVVEGRPLFALHAIEAHVVGRELASLWKSKRLIGTGTREGVQDDQWVLDSRELIVDQGEVQNVMPGLMAFAGRSIVGRVSEAGRHVSSIELVTDRTFRAQASIGRRSGDRLSFSGAGLLEGDGNGMCRMTLSDAAESVAVGDAVYSVPTEPSFETPLLFGHVVSAAQSALQWELFVEPAVDASRLRTVQILAPTLNPDRLVGRN